METAPHMSILVALADAIEARYGTWMSEVDWANFVAGQDDGVSLGQMPREVKVLAMAGPAAVVALALLVEDQERRIRALEEKLLPQRGDGDAAPVPEAQAPREPAPGAAGPRVRLWCSVCGQRQVQSPSGVTCPSGHGGALGVSCMFCRDTREMRDAEVGRVWMCTHCPSPCEDCRTPRGAYCADIPCPCLCHAYYWGER